MPPDDPAKPVPAKPVPAPGRGPDAAEREAERKRRLAAALRDNLRKRKPADRGASPADRSQGEPES